MQNVQHALASFGSIKDSNAGSALKSMLSSTGFVLITFEKRFEEADPPRLASFTLDDYFRECAYALRHSTSYGRQIMEYLSRLDYFCLTEQEYADNNTNPFLKNYLIPMLNDVAEGYKLLIWKDEEWMESHPMTTAHNA